MPTTIGGQSVSESHFDIMNDRWSVSFHYTFFYMITIECFQVWRVEDQREQKERNNKEE